MTVAEWLSTPTPYLLLAGFAALTIPVAIAERTDRLRAERDRRIAERRARLAERSAR